MTYMKWEMTSIWISNFIIHNARKKETSAIIVIKDGKNGDFLVTDNRIQFFMGVYVNRI